MRSIQSAFRLALAAFAFVVVADVASACTYACVNVGPGWCQRCIDVGYATGGSCQDSGQCGCFDVQDICWNSVSLTGVDEVLASLSQAPEEPQALTPAPQPAVE